MDITPTIQANSAQVNADDFTGSPRTVTITAVEKGTSEQPVFIHLEEFPGRTYRPGLSMRRAIVALWGPESSTYIGRRLTLFNDQTIRFGKDVTGGIRISHASHITKTTTIPLTVTRGRRAPFTVEPLAEAPRSATGERVAKAVTAINATTTPEQLAQIQARISADIATEPAIIQALEAQAGRVQA